MVMNEKDVVLLSACKIIIQVDTVLKHRRQSI